MNIVDLLILLGLILALFDGWRRGVLAVVLDLVSLALALLGASWLYGSVGGWIGKLGLSAGLQPLLGFLFTFLALDSCLRWILAVPLVLVPHVLRLGLLARLAGAGLGVGKQVAVTAVVISLLLYLPVLPVIRTSIQSSRFGPAFVLTHPTLERVVAAIIDPAIGELQEFTTVTRITEEGVPLDLPLGQLEIDRSAEQELFRLVNQERASRGLGTLVWNEQLAEVGRAHSRDMWERQFFSHVNPDGKDPFDRLNDAGIRYLAAGENLALAPTTPTAHQGLMDSSGHRENILGADYGQLGIGAVRNGLYGVTYTQLFTD